MSFKDATNQKLDAKEKSNFSQKFPSFKGYAWELCESDEGLPAVQLVTHISKQKLDTLFHSLDEIDAHCIDKQRVREAIDDYERVMGKATAFMLRKRLGLEEEP